MRANGIVRKQPVAAVALESVVAGYFRDQVVLNSVSLAAANGKITVILGPNGSGKSTTLLVMYGFLKPRSGRVLHGEQDISEESVESRLPRGIAFLPQGRSGFRGLTVEDNLLLGGWRSRAERAGLSERLHNVYDRYPGVAKLRKRTVGALSGGQQRLVEVARMMMSDPETILVDEPSVGLAPVLVDEVYEELVKLHLEGRTLLLVDQNVRAALEIASYVYTLSLGQNHLEGEAAEFKDRERELIREWLRF